LSVFLASDREFRLQETALHALKPTARSPDILENSIRFRKDVREHGYLERRSDSNRSKRAPSSRFQKFTRFALPPPASAAISRQAAASRPRPLPGWRCCNFAQQFAQSIVQADNAPAPKICQHDSAVHAMTMSECL
jgi:hypothetical protein